MPLNSYAFLVRFTALVALCLFVGDLAANLCDAGHGSCCEMSTPDSGSHPEHCEHCDCAVHHGTVIACEPVQLRTPAAFQTMEAVNPDERAPGAVPPGIDHPPRYC